MTRIATTHTSSLPRPKDLLGLLQAREEGRLHDEATLHARARSAVFDFMTSPSPGQIGRFLQNTFYASDDATSTSTRWPK